MHPTHLLAALLRQAADTLECREHPAASSPFDGVPNQLEQVLRNQALLIKETRQMSQSIQQLQESANTLKAKLDAAEQRDQARAAVLSSLKSTLDAQTGQLTALQAQLAAMPQDTAAQESAIASVIATLQAASAEADTIAADPAPAPAPEPVVTEPPAAPVEPASTTEPTAQ